MTIYQPIKPMSRLERFTDWCRDTWGVDAPEFATTMVLAFMLPVVLGLAVVVQL
ncbi:hypothetical protein Rleg2_1134 [Rhizobium leguminosarum bv. trifolii WSM2304]|uniref:Uncharacterized protein n=1 Tax=Rhizobium leguminosarum bv. trifolii (strain WSM2304) TaxID=395492 RepID=A0ABF7QK61_RHILW|nr:hypothetical protein [Rhizobium leguminosarum]ACI54428.1 hypothetical protein Rleg2_1134 [Rhizobium leguminosarum bv. trifolii WSM2304]